MFDFLFNFLFLNFIKYIRIFFFLLLNKNFFSVSCSVNFKYNIHIIKKKNKIKNSKLIKVVDKKNETSSTTIVW
jgi:hypothetical protein